MKSLKKVPLLDVKKLAIFNQSKLCNHSRKGSLSKPFFPKTERTLNIGGTKVLFPFEPYDSQLKVMENIISALNDGKNALLESPTGTGKSLAILCSSLAWLKQSQESQNQLKSLPCGAKEPDKIEIYIASRTHKQLKQLISELQNNTNYRPQMAILGSRKFLCVNEDVKNQPNNNDLCNDMIKNFAAVASSSDEKLNICQYYKKGDFSKFLGKDEVFDADYLVCLGKKLGGCPYFTSKSLALTRDVIFSPYTYLLDPIIRESMKISVKGNIFILDEAHNIEDAARDASGFSFNEDSLTNVIKNLEISQKYDVAVGSQIRYLLALIRQLNYWMGKELSERPLERDGERQEKLYDGDMLLEMIQNLGVTRENFESKLVVALKIIKEYMNRENSSTFPGKSDKKLPKILISNASVSFIEGIFKIVNNVLVRNYHRDYQAILTQSARLVKDPFSQLKLKKDSNIQFICLSPEIAFKDLASEARSVILTSGTLSPMSTFASEFQTSFPLQLEAGHVIKESQIWAGIIPCGPKGNSLVGVYRTTSLFEYQDDVGEAILECIRRVPHGVLCFVSSYSLMDKFINRWKSTGLYTKLNKQKHILCEPRDKDQDQSVDTLSKYLGLISESKKDSKKSKSKKSKGALLFAVFRGKVSEGMDFKDENARAVISIGIPYPHWMDRSIQLKIKYNNHHVNSRNLISGEAWYEAQAFRAINQAIGRCIRHEKDWGAIILLEQRFHLEKNSNKLSAWLRENLVVHDEFSNAMDSLTKFVDSNVTEKFSPCYDTQLQVGRPPK